MAVEQDQLWDHVADDQRPDVGMPEAEHVLREVPLARNARADCIALNGWKPAAIIASITPSVGMWAYFADMAA